MAAFAYLLILIATLACCAVAVYLLARILKIYRKARELEAMRGYETILRLSLPTSDPEAVVRELLPRVKPGPMRRVLSRLAEEGDEEWRSKVRKVADLLGMDLATGDGR
ncbi:MAG: hypothetical protein WHT46_03775 [Candidatus Geothermincolales bacterium]